MIKFDATVTWRSEDAKALTVEPFSGIQPSFAIGEDLIISQVLRSDGGREMRPGQAYEVEIRLPYGEAYQRQITPGLEFSLNVGGRVVALGRVLRVHW
jgi:hypothetical protein